MSLVTTAPSSLDDRKKRVDIIKTIEDIKINRTKEEFELEKRKIELDQMKNKENGWSHPVNKLLDVASAWCVDNSSTFGSDTKLKSLWEEHELEFIKKKILTYVSKF